MSKDLFEYGVIYLDGKSYPVVPNEQYSNLATFSQKVTMGDYTRDSDNLISAKIWTEWTGGIGIDNPREGSDDGHYWTGTLLATNPYQLSLNRLTTSVASVSYPIGEYAGYMYLASASSLYKWDESTGSITSVGSLGATPVNRGVAWQGKLYIPQSTGYQTYNGATVAAQVTTAKAIDFIEWDERLWALTSDSKLMYTQDGSSWVDSGGVINTSITPKRLAVYLDSNNNDSIYILTDAGLLYFDPVSQRIGMTRARFPRHPDNGLGVGMWRTGEDLYMSAGLEVYRWTFSSISQVGPIRNEGLPSIYRGKIVDLCPEHNALYALVQGVTETSSGYVEPTVIEDPGMWSEPNFNAAPTTSNSTLMYWTGLGWHHAWVASGASATPTWMCVSGAQDTYRIWWGAGSYCYTQKLPRTFANPRSLVDSGEGAFAASGYIETGWFDGGMRMFDKIASHVEIESTLPTDTSVTLMYKIDDDQGWTTFNIPITDGFMKIPFGVRTVGGASFSDGTSFKRIKFRIELATNDSTTTPIIDHITLKFIKVPIATASWVLSIPLAFREWDDRSPDQIKEEIDSLVVSNRMIQFEHGSDHQRSRRVYVARVGGVNMTGEDERGSRDITLVEVPLASWEGVANG